MQASSTLSASNPYQFDCKPSKLSLRNIQKYRSVIDAEMKHLEMLDLAREVFTLMHIAHRHSLGPEAADHLHQIDEILRKLLQDSMLKECRSDLFRTSSSSSISEEFETVEFENFISSHFSVLEASPSICLEHSSKKLDSDVLLSEN